MTNAPTGNAVLMYKRDQAGTLQAGLSFFTVGKGSGGREPDFGLGNAGALVLNEATACVKHTA
ncbi:MAG: hypothetical protein WC782_06605 [Methylococcaceae bacterium]|jgi:hypothetical protein